MIRVTKIFHLMCAALLCLGVSGCFSSSRSKVDEEKEPYFQAGKSCESRMDFDGAIESFEKAVEVNPRSASAHFELGLLYRNDNRDCAAAIYHFNRYLMLTSTNSPNAGVINDHIMGCKQVLARDVMLGTGAQSIQRELDQLVAENKQLQQQVESLKAANAGRAISTAGTNPTTNANVVSGTSNGTSSLTTSAQTNSVTVAGRSTSGGVVTSAARTYKVQKDDTLAAIARRNGLKLAVLMAANPGIEPQKLKIGQSLNIPAP